MKWIAANYNKEGNDHYHLDSNNFPEDSSSELIIKRVE